MKKILVTTDLSKISRAAIRFAIEFADQTPSELIFYTVDTSLSLPTFTNQNHTDQKNATLENKLKKFILSIFKTTKKQTDKVAFIVEKHADVDKAILAYAKKCNADFICINTSGPGIFNHLIGTTASKLITTSSIPILLVPYTYRMKPIKSLLYASDLAKIGIELQKVKKFAALFDANITVNHYTEFLNQANFKDDFKTISKSYQSDTVLFNFMKLNIEFSLLDHLKRDIRKSRPSIIVMFTKQNRDWLERHFLSSKTKEFGFDTYIPILVFRK